MSDVNDGYVDKVEARRRKLYCVAREHQLSKQDRIDLCQYLLRRDYTSWKELSDQEVRRLLDAFEGYELISFIQRTTHEQRPLATFDPEPSGS
jgi:hypothetical protein